jgi:hypothetical protein
MGGAGSRVKGLLSQRISPRGELENSSRQPRDLTKPGQKAPLIRRSYSLFLWVMMKKGVSDDNVDDDE